MTRSRKRAPQGLLAAVIVSVISDKWVTPVRLVGMRHLDMEQ